MTNRLICFYIFLICIISTGHAQIVNPKDNIRAYYEFINKAELAIIDSAYNSALSYYVEAGRYKWLNADDLYNAGIVAYLANDTNMSKHYLNMLATFGLKKADFEARQWGQQIKSEPLYQYISADYDSIFYKSSMNSPMIFYGQKMKPFMDKDQSVRGFIFDENGIPIAPAPEGPNRDSSDYENRVSMARYIAEYGFPSFKQTGFYDAMRRLDASGTYWYLCWHSYLDTILPKITLNAVLDGDFPPDDYALYCDIKIQFSENILYNTILDSFYTEKQIQLIDEKRSKIYLDPLKDYIRKLEYRNKDKRFLMLNDFAVGINKFAKLIFIEQQK